MASLIEEFLDTEGNTEKLLRDEIDNAVENAKDNA